MPEVFLQRSLPDGVQPDGTVRVALPEWIPEKDKDDIGFFSIEGGIRRLDIGFKARNSLYCFLALLKGYVHFDPEELKSRKTSLVELVAESLTNQDTLPEGQLLHLLFTEDDVRGVDTEAVTFVNQGGSK